MIMAEGGKRADDFGGVEGEKRPLRLSAQKRASFLYRSGTAPLLPSGSGGQRISQKQPTLSHAAAAE